MPITLVNTANGADMSGSLLPSITTNSFVSGAGNLLVAIVRQNLNTIPPSSVTDAAGDTFTQITSASMSASNLLTIWYAKNILGSLGVSSEIVTANWGQPHSFVSIMTLQYSGCDTTAPLDISATGTAGSGTTVTSGVFTTSFPNEVIVAAASQNLVTQGLTAGLIGGTLSTMEVLDRPAGTSVSGAEDLIVNTIRTGITASMSGNTAVTWEMVVATFKAAPVVFSPEEEYWNSPAPAPIYPNVTLF